MGVEGAFRYLETKGISGESVDVQDIDTTIHVDVLSLLRAYISSTRKSILLGIRLKDAHSKRRDRTEDDVEQECTLQLSRCVSAKLKQLGFRPDHAVLHFDGSSSIQKTKARNKRVEATEQQTKTVQLQVLRTVLTIHLPPRPRHLAPPGGALAITPPPSRDPLNEPDDPAPTVNRARKEKVMRNAERAMRSYRTAAVMEKGFLKSLMHSLSTEWEVHQCRGEADVCIPSTGCDIVATSDSDFLFHGVDTVLRQDPKDRTKFLCYNMDDILFQLHMTWPMWTVAAVVSNNDYSEHIRGQGFSSNVDLIQKIRGAPKKSEQALLASYCSTVSQARGIHNLDPQRYQHAASVFIRLEEDIQKTPLITSGLDQELADMIEDVETFRRLHRMQHPYGPNQSAELESTMDIEPDQESAELGSTMEIEPDQEQAALESALHQQAPNPAEDIPKAPKRPHEKYMSPNKFRITTFTMPETGAVHDQGTSASASSTKKKKKKKGTKRKRKTLYNPSSRRARQDSSDSSTGRIRMLRPSTLVDQVLSSSYSTLSLDCGTLSTQVKAGLRHNEVGDEAERDELAKTIVSLIQELVYIGNEVTRCAQQALACYFAEVIAAHPTLSPEDVQERRAKFSQFSGFRNNTFFTNLLQDIFCWHDQRQVRSGRPRVETPANSCVQDILRAYGRALDRAEKAVPHLKRRLSQGLTHFLQQCGVRLADQFQCHFLKHTAELVQRLKVENPQWVSGEGRAILRTIDTKKGTSTVHDQLSLFWILNSHLPPPKQMTFLPESGFTDSFVHITERHMIEALYANSDTPLVFGARADDAQSHLTDHPGDLTYRLFFNPRLQYLKSTVLMNPDEDCAGTADKALFCLEEADQRRYQALVRNLEKADRHVESRGLFKAFLGEHLQTADGNKELLDQGEITSKYVLTGSICTNGHELQVLAYGLIKGKPPSTPPPNTTRAKLADACTVFASEDTNEDLLPDSDYVIVGIDPGICSTATATVIDTRTPGKLKNVSVTQGAQRHCTKTYLRGLQRAKRGTAVPVQLPGDEDPKVRTIEELEGTITPVSCSVPPNEAQGPSWSLLSQSLLDHVQSLLLVQEHLRAFYTSRLYKIKSYHRKTAIKATLNRAVDRIISASGLTEKWEPDKGPRPIFVVGDGSFGSNKGPILHQQFITHLKKKAQALNMIVVCVDEFRTSKICCHCESVCDEQGRSLKCPGCGFQRDRDHNAATNMARAVLMLLQEGHWPNVLCRDYDLESGFVSDTQSQAPRGVAA